MRANGILAVMVMVLFASLAGALEVSVKNNIGGHMEYAGFTVVPVQDVQAPAQTGDRSAPQMFEVVRPGNQAFTLGRLYTSCTCIQIAADKKVFGSGERAFITLRNVRHSDGQMFPFYIQVTSPVSVILRHDAWVKSDVAAAVVPAPAEPATVTVTPEPAAVAAEAAVTAVTTAVTPSVPGYQPVALPADVFETGAYAAPASAAAEYAAPQGEVYLKDEDLF